jgi:MFS family permease
MIPAMSFMGHEAAGLDRQGLDAARTRSRWVLFLTVALGSTGHLAAVTVAALAGKELLGSAALAGAPGAAVVFGAAMGAVALSSLMARRGRRLGLTSGYVMSIVGAGIGAYGIVIGSFVVLIVGTFLIGFGNSSNNLSRYAAADMAEPERRPVAIGLVVWGSTVGGIVGPLLVPFASDLASRAGLPPLAGPYLVPIVMVGAAAALSHLLLRPDPFALATDAAHPVDPQRDVRPAWEILRRPAVLAAVVALACGQATMVLIMTITPVHLDDHGHSLGTVGFVISGHVVGMFALAPVSGWITQRIGSVPTIFLGTAVLVVAALLAALAPPERSDILAVALFLLGYGWNLGFVAGSSLLSASVHLADRARVQGAADAVIWTTSALASLGSGAIVAAAGFSTLGLLGAGLVLVPIWLLLQGRRSLTPGTGTGTAGAA